MLVGVHGSYRWVKLFVGILSLSCCTPKYLPLYAQAVYLFLIWPTIHGGTSWFRGWIRQDTTCSSLQLVSTYKHLVSVKAVFTYSLALYDTCFFIMNLVLSSNNLLLILQASDACLIMLRYKSPR